jgi:hypothetical protein
MALRLQEEYQRLFCLTEQTMVASSMLADSALPAGLIADEDLVSQSPYRKIQISTCPIDKEKKQSLQHLSLLPHLVGRNNLILKNQKSPSGHDGDFWFSSEGRNHNVPIKALKHCLAANYRWFSP